MTNKKTYEHLFILESPGPQDMLDGRAEGKALSAALKLAGIPSHYFSIANKDIFQEAFHRIRNLYIELRESEPKFPVPHFHISAHGHDQGIGLTSGEIIGWHELRNILLDFASALGFIDDDLALFVLCMSTCQGSASSKMFDLGTPYPCAVIIGPETNVTWPDALTAWTTFYHQLIIKNINGPDAVKIMNVAAGLENIFKAHISKNLSK